MAVSEHKKLHYIWYNTIFTRINEIILVHIWEKHKEKKRKAKQAKSKVFNRLIHSKVNLSNDKKLIDKKGNKQSSRKIKKNHNRVVAREEN